MNAKSNRRGLKSLLLGLVFIAACLTFGFSVTSKNSANVMFDSSTIDQAFPFDLSTNSDIKSHLSNLSSISVNSATITVASLGTDNTVTSVSGSLTLLPAGAALDAGCSGGTFVGSITNFAITSGASYTVVVDGGSALDQYMQTLLKGPNGDGGTLAGAAVICGTAMGALPDGGVIGDFTLDLNVVYNVNYNWP
jgi:hypothetical protein